MTHAEAIERVRKLLRLADGERNPDEHEAALAAARAAQIMADFEIASYDLRVGEEERAPDEPVGEYPLENAKQRLEWRGILASAAARSFGCHMFWRPVRGGYATKIVARQSDMDAVRYTYEYFCRAVEELAAKGWRRICLERQLAELGEGTASNPFSSAVAWKRSFARGAATTILSRVKDVRSSAVRDAVARASAPANALARVERRDEAVRDYVAGLNLRSSRGSRVSDSSGYNAGREAGHSVRMGGAAGALGAPARQIGGRAQ